MVIRSPQMPAQPPTPMKGDTDSPIRHGASQSVLGVFVIIQRKDRSPEADLRCDTGGAL